MSRETSFFERYYIHRDTTGVMNRGFNVSVQFNHHISDSLLSNALRQLVPSNYCFYSNAFRNETEETALLDKTISGGNGNLNNSDRDGLNNSIGLDGFGVDAREGGRNYHIYPVRRVLYSELVQKRSVEVFHEDEFYRLSQIRIPVNVQKPTYYLTLLEERSTGLQYVVFSSNHMLFDGTSAMNFLEDLGLALASVSDDSEPVEVLFDADKMNVHVEPAGDSKCDLYSSSLWYKVWTFFKLHIPSFLVKIYRSYFCSEGPNLFRAPIFTVASFESGSDSRFHLVQYNSTETTRLLQKCRQNGSTVTALLTAQLVKNIEEAFLPHLGPFSSNFSIAVNGRRYFPDLDLRYGLYITSVSEDLAPGKSVWSNASQISKALKQCFENRRPFMFTGLLEYVNIWRYMQGRLKSGQRGTVEVSNLGRVSFPETAWVPEQILFSQSVTDTHFVCSCVSTSNGLNIMIAYHKSLDAFEWQGQKTAKRCIENFRTQLLE